MKIEETNKTPEVTFNNGVLTIKGRSIPEDSHKFYEPIIEMFKDYSNNPEEVTVVDVKLEYFNTSSSKALLDLFKILEKIYKNGKQASLIWRCEEDDDDMVEAGEDYGSILRVKVAMVVD